jgi:hypothetical protein
VIRWHVDPCVSLEPRVRLSGPLFPVDAAIRLYGVLIVEDAQWATLSVEGARQAGAGRHYQ